ncbi:MAG: zinc ABC transporter substrate-binding protein [Solirubrobacteraceae bacterium]|nr:zinc ABC transporter substrate-binding protein [Solirubrobacteraceae bacterium]
MAVATAPQMDSLLQALAGKGVRVETVVPPTADLHEVELRPSQVRSLREAQLIVRPGRDNDTWAAEALKQVDGEQVDAAKGLPGSQRHWWMDPAFASKAAGTIANALNRLDPDGQAARATALRELQVDLAAIDQQTKTCLATVPDAGRGIVTDHDAAGAYAERYGLTVVGTISPGADPEAAPSAQRVAELEDLMRAKHVAALFPIAPHGSALAKTIAERGGAVLGDPLWADALPGATHDHEAEAEDTGEHADHTAEEHAAAAVVPTLQEAARLNGASVAKALGAKSSACSSLSS